MKPIGIVLRNLINFFFLLAMLLILIVLLKMTNGYFLFAGLLSVFCIGCPVIIRFSSQSILEEKNKIDIQKSRELPIRFEKRKVILGYIGTLFLFWLLPAAVFLLPDKTWVLIGPPVWLTSFAVIKLTEHTWLAFGWKKWTYWGSQGVIVTFLFTASLIIKIICE